MSTKERLQRKLQMKKTQEEHIKNNIKNEFSYILSMMCFGYSIIDAIEKRKTDIASNIDVDKGHPAVYEIKNIENILLGYNDDYTKYIHLMQEKFNENYEDCVIKSNFLTTIADECDRNKTFEEIKQIFNKEEKKRFDELAETSSEFVMNIFCGDKDKFQWVFDVVTKMEHYKTSKISESCIICGTTEHLNFCSCREIAYCSASCQTQDWPVHKKLCKFYFKQECKKEFDFILSQPIKFSCSKKELKKLDEENKSLLERINTLITESDSSNLLENKPLFDLIIKGRSILYFVKNPPSFKKCGGSLSIYEKADFAINELKKLYILNK